MKLIIAEKNDAARQIAERLSTGKPKKDKVYNTAIYRFEWKGEECVTIGLAGHILAPDFCDSVLFDKKLGWYSVTEDGEMLPADMPDGLARPPYDTKRKPFLADGISIKGWKLESLPYLTWAPVIKLPAEKELIRSLKNLAKKSDSVIIATDFDREGELIGSDALNKVREVAPDLPVARAQYSSFTKAEITQAFDNLVSLDQSLADAEPPAHRPYLGRGAHALSDARQVRRLWQRALRRPRADADACPGGRARARAHGVCARGLLADPRYGCRAGCCRGRPL